MDAMVRQGTPAYFTPHDLRVAHLETVCDEQTLAEDFPLAASVEKDVPVYQAAALLPLVEGGDDLTVKTEWALCLRDGPGVFVIRGAYADTAVIDASSDLFAQIVADEKAAGSGQGDHFGNNERIWNASQKVCERSPADFLNYYSNPFLALACEAWLGPCYQITAQMNTVKPGSKAQAAHRDYHLGFQAAHTIDQYPAHAQMMSQFLTLQGAVAHGDMPLPMGPTMFLPHSQKVPAGYLSFTTDEARAYFDANYVQLPLNKGDMVFFSPALMHGAGTNQTDSDRVANLLQISSAFGRPMETVNRLKMIKAAYPELLKRYGAGMADNELRYSIAAIADGYSFPTNLDSDPPVGGNAPETAQQMLRRALQANATLAELEAELTDYAARQSA